MAEEKATKKYISTYNLAEALQDKGYKISQPTIYRQLKDLGYTLQSNKKIKEGTDPPDRDSQFNYIYNRIKKFQQDNCPI